VSRSTTRSARPLARHALLAAGAALLLSACSAGQVTQTSTKLPSVQGANGEIGDVVVRNVSVPFPDNSRSWPKGGSAPLVVSIANTGNSADKLVEVRAELRDDKGELQKAAGFVQVTPGAGTAPSAPATGAPATPGATATPQATGTPSNPATPSPAGSPAATPGTPESPGTPATPGELPTGSPEQAPIDLELPAAALVPGDAARALLTLNNLAFELTPASELVVTFVFERAGELRMNVPVAPPLSPLPRSAMPEVLEHAEPEGAHG
jgi:hypothetical protein